MLWTEDQELELQRLFEEFQDSDGERGGARGASERRAPAAASSRGRLIVSFLSTCSIVVSHLHLLVFKDFFFFF